METHSNIPMKDNSGDLPKKTIHVNCSWRKPDIFGRGRRTVDRFEFPLSHAERRVGSRRVKDGSPEDRKATADCIRRGRQIEKDKPLPWYKQIWRTIMPVVLVLMMTCSAHAYTAQDEIKAIIGEAGGESLEGKSAVACAIHNRGTLHGVYGLHAARVIHHRYSKKTYRDAQEAIEMAQDQEYCQSLIGNASYWEGTKFPLPYWAKGMTVTAVIGNQKFFQQ